MKVSYRDILPCFVAIIIGSITGAIYLMSMMIIIGIIFLPALPVYLATVAILFYIVGKNRYLLAGTLHNITVLAILHLYTGISGLIYPDIGDGKGPVGILFVVVGGIVFSIPAYLLAWFFQKREEQKSRLVAANEVPPTIDSSRPSDSV